MLPNVIVIGAARCGTTSLHEYLDKHPEISMSHEKELNFFVAEKNWTRGFHWYEAQFDNRSHVRGESSPSYSAFPLYRGVAERIAQTIPQARLIYLVRDPIERIISHYMHRTVKWPQMGPLENALDDEGLRERLVTPSRYWVQLEQYLARFPEDQILVVDSDELRTHRRETLRSVFAFLGVEASFATREFDRSHNAATGRTKLNRPGRTVARLLERTLGERRAQLIRARAPSALKAPFHTMLAPPVLPERLREGLAQELRGDVERLRAHTGLSFSAWSL